MTTENLSEGLELDPTRQTIDTIPDRPLVSDAEINAAYIARLRENGEYPPVLPPYTPATSQELLDSSRY